MKLVVGKKFRFQFLDTTLSGMTGNIVLVDHPSGFWPEKDNQL